MSAKRVAVVGMPIFSAWSVVLGMLVCFAVVVLPSSANGQVTLVADGQPKALIVIPSEDIASQVELNAARILAEYLFQMSGARLSTVRENELGEVNVEGGRLVPESGKAGDGFETFVLVGEGDIAKRLGMTSEGLGAGGTLMKTGGNVLALLGPRTPSDMNGTRHAVFTFLEELGCRYLWPGELGKVVPKQSTITVKPLDARFTPPIGQRKIRCRHELDGAGRTQRGLNRLQLTAEEWLQARQKAIATKSGIHYLAWHRLGGNLGVGGGHAGAGLGGDGWRKHGKEHPEWFSLQPNGTRDQGNAGERFRLCMSNQELIEFVADKIIKRVNADPSLTCVSLSPNDGGSASFCICENCKKLDPPHAPPITTRGLSVQLSDRMVYYWSRVAKRVTEVHPDMLFIVDAYSIYETPPVVQKVHPNLVLRYVQDWVDDFEGWRAAGSNRIYWRPNTMLANFRTGTPHILVEFFAENMKYLADNGVLATDFDAVLHSWAADGINYYAVARLNWNPYLTGREIIDDYCDHGFGKAAPSVKRYFIRLQEVAPPVLAEMTNRTQVSVYPWAMPELRRFLNDADRVVGDDETIRSRIAFIRYALNFLDLQLALNKMVEQANLKDSAKVFRHNRSVKREDSDPARVRRLLELNYLTMRDIVRNHNLAINVTYLMYSSNDYSHWAPIGGHEFRPAKELIERVDAAKLTLTGHENNIEEMLAVFGLDKEDEE